MATHDPELSELLDEPPAGRAAPVLVPWGWRIFFVLLAGFDLVCLIAGRVPWSGGARGLDRLDTLVILLVGTGLGLVIGLVAEAVAASRAAQLGLTAEESRLIADDLSILTRPSRSSRVSIVPLVALVWVLCTLAAKLVFREASLPATTVFIALHALTGLALPVLWRSYQSAYGEFQAWLDAKNAPFDAEAARRAAAHRARLADLRDRVHVAEDELKERLDKLPRVAPPGYLAPWAVWIPTGLALLLDAYLLCSPEARAAAVDGGGAGKLIWLALGLWVQSCIVIGIAYAFIAWYYQSIADQASRQWHGRDWSGGVSVVAIEALFGGLALALLAGLALGWHVRFVAWNILAATPLLLGVLTDIRRLAVEHHERSVEQRAHEAGPPPKGKPQAEVEQDDEPE
ncbi:MAG: hypothetical protein FJX74_05850 [Armatimonadetes bacterium]|nr:hypothetical protein [Armatimonadota bacterium]